MLRITDWRQIRMGQNDRAAVIGATGTGKTTLARYLVEDRAKRCSVVYDAKISDSISAWSTHAFYDDFERLKRAEEYRLIYRPSFRESMDGDAQEAFFEWIYWRRYTRLYIDEASAIRGGVNPPFSLQHILARGRERGISTVVSTQRPKRVPLIFFSEAEHFFIFRLNMVGDRERVFELTGIDPYEQTTLEKYEFFYYSVDTGQPSQRLKLNAASVTPTRNGLQTGVTQHARTKATSTISVQHKAA